MHYDQKWKWHVKNSKTFHLRATGLGSCWLSIYLWLIWIMFTTFINITISNFTYYYVCLICLTNMNVQARIAQCYCTPCYDLIPNKNRNSCDLQIPVLNQGELCISYMYRSRFTVILFPSAGIINYIFRNDWLFAGIVPLHCHLNFYGGGATQ